MIPIARPTYHERDPETDLLLSVVLHSSSSGLGQVCLCSEPVGCEQTFERTAEPSGQGPFAVDGPVEHGAPVDLLDEPGQIGGVAGLEFVGRHGIIEEFLGFVADGGELRQGDGVKLGIDERGRGEVRPRLQHLGAVR
jgi:hypothetical protein